MHRNKHFLEKKRNLEIRTMKEIFSKWLMKEVKALEWVLTKYEFKTQFYREMLPIIKLLFKTGQVANLPLLYPK